MEKDWRKLIGRVVGKEVKPEFKCLEFLGALNLDMERNENGKEVTSTRFDAKYTNLIYKIGQGLIEGVNGKGYWDLPLDNESQTYLFFTRIAQILELYERSSEEFLTYSSLTDAVAGYALVPNLMIFNKQLLKKPRTPPNQVPVFIEFCLKPSIRKDLSEIIKS